MLSVDRRGTFRESVDAQEQRELKRMPVLGVIALITLAYGYIKKARDQGFTPAVEAEALFAGRLPDLRGNPVSGQQVALTNRSE